MQANLTCIAITNPYRWPYVRRGSERILNDLTEYMVKQGYQLETYSMGPKNEKWEVDNVKHLSIQTRFKTSRRQFNECHYFAHALQSKLAHSSAQIVHCLNYFDAYAAIKARRKYKLKYKVIFHAVGIPTAKYFRAVPIDAHYFRTTLRYADEIWALSQFAQNMIQQDFNVNCDIMPPPVNIDTLAKPKRKQAPYPKILESVNLLFVGDCNEPRKGVNVLLEALVQVKQVYPHINLRLSGNADNNTIGRYEQRKDLQTIMPNVQFLGTGKVSDLPLLYSQADLTILPSVWEAFGLVVVESLAQGTPVVGCNHAGIVDIINSPNVGELFEPGEFTLESHNVNDLAKKIIVMLKRLEEKDVYDDCINRATEFSWSTLGKQYESRYKELALD